MSKFQVLKGFESNVYYVFDIMMRFLDIENSVMKSMSLEIEKSVMKSDVNEHWKIGDEKYIFGHGNSSTKNIDT